jgi:hypothetical protein
MFCVAGTPLWKHVAAAGSLMYSGLDREAFEGGRAVNS